MSVKSCRGLVACYMYIRLSKYRSRLNDVTRTILSNVCDKNRCKSDIDNLLGVIVILQ